MSRFRKPLEQCANHPGRKPDPPSLVLCRECQDEITAKMEAMLANMQARSKTADCREDCPVPGRCSPKHVDCSLTWQEKRDLEADAGDAMYHSWADEQAAQWSDERERD